MNRLYELRTLHKMSMRQVAEALEMPYTTYVNYEKGAREPGSEVLIRIADFYNVSTDYLIGRQVDSSKEEKKVPALSEKDRRDIAKDLEAIMVKLDSSGDLMFDGDPISDEARESIRAAMKLGLEAAKLKNKERFTSKKYRKE